MKRAGPPQPDPFPECLPPLGVIAGDSLTQVSSLSVPEPRRVDFWEEYNASVLTGIRCSTHDESGLKVGLQRRVSHDLAVSDIRGNEHIVERTPLLARQYPKESLFVCLPLEGHAFFYQRNTCLTLSAGDILIYNADQPFLYGFTGAMRQILIDLPCNWLAENGIGMLDRPVRIEARIGTGRTLSGALRRASLALIASGARESATRCRHLATATIPGGSRRRSGLLALIEAKTIIAEHLARPDLDPSFVSTRIGLSQRHLNRLFEEEGTSVARHISEARLSQIHRDLSDTDQTQATIGEIAYRWGYTDLPSFNHAFKRRFDMRPGDVRRKVTKRIKSS